MMEWYEFFSGSAVRHSTYYKSSTSLLKEVCPERFPEKGVFLRFTAKYSAPHDVTSRSELVCTSDWRKLQPTSRILRNYDLGVFNQGAHRKRTALVMEYRLNLLRLRHF